MLNSPFALGTGMQVVVFALTTHLGDCHISITIFFQSGMQIQLDLIFPSIFRWNGKQITNLPLFSAAPFHPRFLSSVSEMAEPKNAKTNPILSILCIHVSSPLPSLSQAENEKLMNRDFLP
jgi:hypothetical protein